MSDSDDCYVWESMADRIASLEQQYLQLSEQYARDSNVERITGLVEQVAELTQECDRYREALQDIVDDPIISEPLGMKRGLSDVMRIAKKALEDSDE
jgi:hypothetical protein